MNISVFETALDRLPPGKYFLRTCINFPEGKLREQYGVCLYSKNGGIRRGGKEEFKRFEHLELLKYASKKVREKNVTSFQFCF